MSNILEKLIEKYPDKPWNWGDCGLSYNSFITPEFIEKYIDKDWDWDEYGLSSNRFLKDPYFTSKKYIDRQKVKNFKILEKELIEKTWCSKRLIDWCLDNEEKQDFL